MSLCQRLHKSMRLKNFRTLHLVSNWYNSRFTFAGKCIATSAAITALLGVNVFRSSTYQLFAVFASMLLLSLFASRLVKNKCECLRILPQMATVGEPLNYKITVKNNSGRNINDLLVIDTLVENYPTQKEFDSYFDKKSKSENWFDRYVGFPRWNRLLKLKTGALFPEKSLSLDSSGQGKKLQMELIPLRRGYLQFSHFQIGQCESTGLFRHINLQSQPDKLLVLPKRYPLSPINLPGKRHHNQGGIALASSVGETSEFQGLRDYQPGDPLRHIHWRSWARTGTPMVKKFDDEFFVRHALILDTYGKTDARGKFEHAVSVAASIALGVEERESILDLMFVENKAYCFTTGRHIDDTLSLLEILACVNMENNQPFSTLTKMVLDHCAVLSSAIFICLAWDEQRKKMAEALYNQGVDFIVLLLREPGDENIPKDQLGVMATIPHRWVEIHTNNIESDIKKISGLFSR